MSSESEDEFQSADEFSDPEDSESIAKTLDQSTPPRVNADSCEKVEKNKNNERTETEKYDKVASDLRQEDSANAVSVTKDETETCLADVSCSRQEDSVSQPMSELSIKDIKSVGQKASDKLHKHSEDDIAEVKDTAVASVRKLKDRDTTQECMGKEPSEHSLEEQKSIVEDHEDQPKETVRGYDEKTRELKDEPTNANFKLETQPAITSTRNIKAESIVDGTGILGEKKPKAIRQSKIGMKKPRDKLGERLGKHKPDVNAAIKTTDTINATKHMEEDSEKLQPSSQGKTGTKAVSQPTDSSSSIDTMRLMKEERDDIQNENQECTLPDESVREDKSEEDEKSKKRQQWEEQQERWQQALNIGKEGKESSSRDDDGWGAPWGGWGSSLLSAATTFTREVGRGVGTVMETVESSIGVPNPEEMAQEIVKQKQQRKLSEEKPPNRTIEGSDKADEEKQASSEESLAYERESGQQTGVSYSLGGFSLGGLVSGVSGALETASSKVLLGGLDTLEVIGRKAMDVIQDGDPGLRRKRAFLSNKKPNLSQMLQEARQKAAQEEQERATDGRNSKNPLKPSFEQAWEDSEGPVHLEALSLVAKQCQTKTTSRAATLPHYLQDKLHRENNVIKSTCELDEEGQMDRELMEVVPVHLSQTGLPLQPQKLIEAWSLAQEKASIIQEADLEQRDQAEEELYQALARLVTQLCALTHKGSELALITPEINPLDLATHFRELAQVVSGSLENMTDQICGTITFGEAADDTQVKDTITNIYLQAATCNNYIQQSLASLASVLQYSNTKLAAAQL